MTKLFKKDSYGSIDIAVGHVLKELNELKDSMKGIEDRLNKLYYDYNHYFGGNNNDQR